MLVSGTLGFPDLERELSSLNLKPPALSKDYVYFHAGLQNGGFP